MSVLEMCGEKLCWLVFENSFVNGTLDTKRGTCLFAGEIA
jgi:hypothetical protein